MDDVLKIIYDKSANNKLLNSRELVKITELLVSEKKLNNYVNKILINSSNHKNLASYRINDKKIVLFDKTILKKIINIENNLIDTSNFETKLYQNLIIVQIIMHEIEHANQQKIAYKDNTLESLILRLSYLVEKRYDNTLYEYCPEERLAEVKSYDEIKELISNLELRRKKIKQIIMNERKIKLFRGYHYHNNKMNVPLKDFFQLANKSYLLEKSKILEENKKLNLYERLKYGLSITEEEYKDQMKEMIHKVNSYYRKGLILKK